MADEQARAEVWRWKWVHKDGHPVEHECSGTVFVGGDTLWLDKLPPPIAHFSDKDEPERFAKYLNALESKVTLLAEAMEALEAIANHMLRIGLNNYEEEWLARYEPILQRYKGR